MGTTFKFLSNQIRTAAILTLCLGGAYIVSAADAPKPAAPVSSGGIKFRPPATGAPSVRVTGGSRGSGETAVTIDVLAPEGIGITTQEQPALYWFQSQPVTAKFELTVYEENNAKPVVHAQVDRDLKAGIQKVKLSEFGAKLTPGVKYQWKVALVTDPDDRTADLIGSGVISRIAPTEELSKKISKASPSSLPALYAEAGIWHDALSTLTEQIEANPKKKNLRQSRVDLLRQAGLKAAAQFEEKGL